MAELAKCQRQDARELLSPRKPDGRKQEQTGTNKRSRDAEKAKNVTRGSEEDRSLAASSVGKDEVYE